MQAEIRSPYRLTLELARGAGSEAVPVYSEDVSADLADLVEEVFVAGVLADRLPATPGARGSLDVRIEPVWIDEPLVDRIDVLVTATEAGSVRGYARSFRHGRWSRRAVVVAARLRENGALHEGERAHARLTATRRDEHPGSSYAEPFGSLSLIPPPVADASLAELGVRSLGTEALDPDRPVLLHRRMVREILEETRAAGTSESGGGTLGRFVRLPEPLPGARSRIVTILSTSLTDDRHRGAPGSFTFDPAALVEAARIADLRGRGETVLTAFHSHGWGHGCDDCNANEGCLLPQCTEVSVDDYVVLESLFPGKATLMPIAGRKLGAPGRDPVLEVHAWKGGRMRPLPWAQYSD